MAGNPNHGKDGRFSSGPATGHNAGEGNRAVADHIKKQHSTEDKISQSRMRQARNAGYGIPGRDLLDRNSAFHKDRENYLKAKFPKEFP